MDKLTAGVLGVVQRGDAIVQTLFFIPKAAPVRDVCEFLHAVGRPVQQCRVHPDGVEVGFSLASAEQARVCNKATARSFTVGGRNLRPQVGVFGEYTLEELMAAPVKDIETFLAAHELGLKEYQDMLAYELAHKNRATLVKGLQALIGEA